MQKIGKLKLKVWEKTINAFEERLMMQFRVHLIIHLALHLKVNFNIFIYKDAQEGAHDVALKGTLLVALGLQLSCNCQCIRVYKIIQHFKDPLKRSKKVTKRAHLKLYLMVHLKVHLSAQSRTPLRAHLKICLMVYFEIYVKMHNKCIWGWN